MSGFSFFVCTFLIFHIQFKKQYKTCMCLIILNFKQMASHDVLHNHRFSIIRMHFSAGLESSTSMSYQKVLKFNAFYWRFWISMAWRSVASPKSLIVQYTCARFCRTRIKHKHCISPSIEIPRKSEDAGTIYIKIVPCSKLKLNQLAYCYFLLLFSHFLFYISLF